VKGISFAGEVLIGEGLLEGIWNYGIMDLWSFRAFELGGIMSFYLCRSEGVKGGSGLD
jgi:hypothetical protein